MSIYFSAHKKNYTCIALTLFLLFGGWSASIQAQEFLTGVKTNPQIYNETKRNLNISLSGKAENPPLLLPFFEDFSAATGYPNEMFFIDKQAFVNQTFAVFPPTIGVVTLDAINEYGEIYPHLNSTSKGADTLTSRYIRLDSLFLGDMAREITLSDSLYFSFYFQPGGGGIADSDAGEQIGNQPNITDSLVLEFGYTTLIEGSPVTFWNHIWSTPGFSIKEWLSEDPYQYFKQVLIPITDEKYLCETFQFRFRNYASLEPQQGMTGWEGNVDQWHIDYIRLDVNRNRNDIFTNDLAFVSPTTSFLKNYQAMPWKQFQSADVKSNFSNQLTNLSGSSRTSRYQYAITRNGNVVHEYTTGAIDINPYFTHGIHNYPSQATPTILFPPANLTDTATFVVTHVFQNAAGLDFYQGNDTCVFEQKFSNYYAYDDGTAEYGYCLNNQYNIAYLAMKFSLRVPDLLSAVHMWFNHTKNDENANASFSIVVWEDENGLPGEKLHTLSNCKPKFAEGFLDFVEYRFDNKISVSGDIWVGFVQHGNVQLNIGFDQNNDSRDFFRYNTRGIWEKSAYKGTPMLRPVFGELSLSIPPNAPLPATKIGPNPVTDELRIENHESRIIKVEIFNITGMKIIEKQCRNNMVTMNIDNCQTGIYFVRVTKENKTIETFKIIKK